jgi:GDP-4-dehydro-6-deoxy-D-mannose reductase
MAVERVLITGGTGFVGSFLVAELLGAAAAGEYEVELHVTAFGSPVQIETQPPRSVQIHYLDLNDRLATAQLIEKIQPTHVYHLAAMAAVGSSFDQTEMVLKNNISLQVSVLDALRSHASAARTLIISSGELYAGSITSADPVAESTQILPTNPYAVSKATQELLAYAYYRSYQLPIIRVRPFNHTGPGQSLAFVVPALTQQIVAVERGQADSVHVGNLGTVRDFTDVRDVVRAYALLMQVGKVGEVYNVASGVGVSIQDIFTKLCARSSANITTSQDEARLRPSDSPVIVGDATRVRQLGWTPTISLDQTLTDSIEYWRSQP